MKNDWEKIIDILHDEVVPATGCTEPVSLAFAAAVAASKLQEPVVRIQARVSPNLMKNGMGVMVPGTGRPGLYIAAAVGALGGNPNADLQVLEGITQDHVNKAIDMVEQQLVSVDIAYDVPYVLYAEAVLIGKAHCVKVCISDRHTNVIYIEKDGNVLFQKSADDTNDKENKEAFLQSLTINKIIDFAEQVPIEAIQFIAEAGDMNETLSQVGLAGKYGLQIGATLMKQQQSGLMGTDLQSNVIIRTVGASDARMGGAKLPAMTNSGSGNQGISATMPVVVVADYVHATMEERLRAMVLSHVTAIYAHAFLPKLSALCAAMTACIGAAVGMAWLLSKKHERSVICNAICNMTGDLSGMICDGAANSCSMKVASASAAAFKAVLLAMEGIRVSGHDGVVAFDVDECIRNIGILATSGMKQTDEEILHIMLNKNKMKV
ncbi:serine dehydratase subunit alpha family protein [uncultured Megasphaera sp.]|uniref:L-cysteine desulfidase family protein n=1 Tax=uncultured Megasphaera sp. TaxID=165188 RepID=UPI00259AF0A3|nr:L-serine ammonia-lyase, iron-sulfur-dependent, subunit alpha [uncultured Megasphaera sp.]